MEPFAAAAAAAWMHGDAACRIGSALIAEDLVEELAPVLRELDGRHLAERPTRSWR
jgi:ADP-dependent NAD(P)H-hydrate dehydratase / NAD(P)H-hydrate epimerase